MRTKNYYSDQPNTTLLFQVVETGFPEFTTFSVGEGEDRRTVVCFQQQLLDFTLGNSRWEKARDTGQFLETGRVKDDDREDTHYLSPVPVTDTVSCSFEYSSSQPVPATQTSQHSSQNKSCQVTPAQPNPSVPVSRGGAGAGQKKRRPERAVYVPPRGRGKPLSANAIEFKPNNSQHVLVSELEPAQTRDMTDIVVTEITTALGGVQIETPAVDYSSFQTSDSTINIDQFGHVIELYDFPQEMKTNDLMSAFSAFTSR